MKLTRRQWLNRLKPAGFAGLVAAIMSAVIMAESGGWTNARRYNPPSIRWPDGTTDRGGAQCNDHWWPQFTDAQCDDPWETGKLCWIISRGGTRFVDWTAFNNGSYVQFLPLRYRALKLIAPGRFP